MKPVKDYYNAIAGDYHQQYRRDLLETGPGYPANYFRLQILLRRLADLRAKSVYEVGVGEGTPLAIIASMKIRVAGCDIAEAMVGKARQTFERHNLDPAVIQRGDIQDAVTIASQIGSEAFDAVIAAGVLPHVENDVVAIENMGMFLRPGGRLFVEFRNKLFSLFTFNRHTRDFILGDLLRSVPAEIKQVVERDLDGRLAIDLPPLDQRDAGERVGYDAILSKFHNPFELLDLFGRCGYRDARIHWYHYHPAPPMLERELGPSFRAAAMSLEHETSWRGYFLCSAGVIEATKSG